MRLLALLVVLTFLPTATAVGNGPITFEEHVVPGISSAPEPTIGIPWNTDDVFYHAGSTTLRAHFEGEEPTWEDVTPPYQVPINVDPMLIADEDTGRIFAGGLHGPCSVMMISDDNGETWISGLNACSGAQFDHQSIGSGPKPGIGNPDNVPQLQNAYYCGQLGQIGCSVSLDGGETWTAPTPFVSGSCGGFHGHWRISRVTGTAFLPVGQCGDQRGMLVASEITAATGITFEERRVEGSHPWVAGFDSSIGISRGSGVLYYGDADHKGAFMGISEDEGLSWEQRPGHDGADTTWVDVGAFHDPPVVAATFADVQAGDDDRAAFTFLGIEEYPGIDMEYVQSDMIFSCGERQEELIWHYYAAFTYDAGHTWEVHRLTDDPVQVGGIYDSLGGHEGGCRNLLDFNDMDIDSRGAVHIGWADGCIAKCAETSETETDGWKSQAPRLFRQTGGRTLFSATDASWEDVPDVEQGGEPEVPQDEGIPAPAWVLLLGLAVALRRRR